MSHMAGVDNKLILIAHRAIEITHIDFGIPNTGGLRTEVEQALLYSQRKSKADGVNNLSKHQTGKALDFFAYVDGKGSWTKEHLAEVACAFMQAAIELDIKIKSGMFFKSFSDYPHIQLEE